ncbi:MAG: amidohydrolase, partial [Oscillospiraceae bacterium]|nr:amidohydrolase [Oscillospiraceae bacterium]
IENVELLELGLPTGTLAKITGSSSGPVVAFRADIDALPITEESGLPYASETSGRMHACGHDFHTTALLGAAELLAQRRARLSGTVVLLFQPAEENAQGAAQVIETGVLRRLNVQEIFALHTRPALTPGVIAVASGPFSAAVDRFLYRITGSGGHASAPETTQDPIPAAARLVGALQEIVSRQVSPLDTAVLSVTRITAGSTWNVIPDSAELEGTVRSFNPAVRQKILGAMERQARALTAEGYQVDFQWHPGCPATNNDADLAELIQQTAKKAGFQVIPQKPDMSGEDFACYQEQIPGVLFHVGTGGQYPIHNAHFAVDEAALAPAAELLADIAEAALNHL